MKRFSLFATLAFALSFFQTVPAFAHDIDKGEVEKIIREYVEAHPDEILTSIQKYTVKQRQNEERAAFDKSLKDRVPVPVGTSPVTGVENASITIVEFSDFQCPFCARASETVAKLKEKYKGRLKLVFKHFPLDFHQQAIGAARASIAAEKQGKFWEYRDILMEKQSEWGNANAKENFMGYAKGLGLDLEKFEKDLDLESSKKQIEDDMALGRKVGVTGTPAFYINGVKLSGAQPIEAFDQVIDTVLADAKN